MKLLTDSASRTYSTCAKRYKYRYIEEIVPIEVPSFFNTGTNFHLYMKQIYNSQVADEAAVLDTFTDKEMAICICYGEEYRHDIFYKTFSSYKILAVEMEFDLPLVNPDTGRESKTFRHGGKIDLVLDDGRDGIIIVDHKTAQNIGGDYIDRVQHNAQLYGYSVAAERVFGKKCTSLFMNVICKPTIRLKKNESEEDFYQRMLDWYGPDKFLRQQITIDKRFLHTVKRDLWERGQQIRFSDYHDYFPRNTNSCHLYNSVCPYFRLCILDMQHLKKTDFEKKRKHEELSETGVLPRTFDRSEPIN